MNALIVIVNDCKELFGPVAPIIAFAGTVILIAAFI